jgi:hypothetical protein
LLKIFSLEKVTMTRVAILPDRRLLVSMSVRYVEFSGFQYYRQLC